MATRVTHHSSCRVATATRVTHHSSRRVTTTTRVMTPQQPTRYYGNTRVMTPQQPPRYYGNTRVMTPQQPTRYYGNTRVMTPQQPPRYYGNPSHDRTPQQPPRYYDSTRVAKATRELAAELTGNRDGSSANSSRVRCIVRMYLRFLPCGFCSCWLIYIPSRSAVKKPGAH